MVLGDESDWEREVDMDDGSAVQIVAVMLIVGYLLVLFVSFLFLGAIGPIVVIAITVGFYKCDRDRVAGGATDPSAPQRVFCSTVYSVEFFQGGEKRPKRD
jgi:hypothetical protein